ncbi:hypothetical protein [Belnapia rosea]|uniref:hypothetical protein n=1 Tax=Belnapia rosea TaxID=938405 RepID=UPI000880E96C|nr:hypothetical protein [Belnapia rosea]SDB19940.1 hypothetical protein SAMN02927895_00780 [Belnapia rosea]
MTLAELREAEAPPEIGALYARLREASGVPLVNLIHRHLATMEGVLPWLWAAIRPPLEDGSLAGARERLAAAIDLPPLAPLPAEDWAAAGLTAEARPAVANLVEVYNRGNLTNLILLTAIRRSLEGTPAEPAPPPPRLAPPAMLPAPPPLPRLGTLPPGLAAQVEALAARHAGTVMPSLYLHLAHWPALPAALPGWAGPLLEPGRIAAARAATLRLAEAEADALRPALAPPGPIPPAHGAAALAVITRFTRAVIPDMVPIGLGLRRLLAPG